MTGPCRKGKKVKSAYLNKGNEQLQDDGLTEEGGNTFNYSFNFKQLLKRKFGMKRKTK